MYGICVANTTKRKVEGLPAVCWWVTGLNKGGWLEGKQTKDQQHTCHIGQLVELYIPKEIVSK